MTHVLGICLVPAVCCPGSGDCALARTVELFGGYQIWQDLEKGLGEMSRGRGEAAESLEALSGTH